MKENNKLVLIIAYYLSKFDYEAVKNLGYSSFNEAFRDIGSKLNVKENTLKNMRDEFDSIHNKRAGWHQRDLRPSREKVVEAFQELEEIDMHIIVNEIINNSEFRVYPEVKDITEYISLPCKNRKFSGFISRGPTGKKAEGIFIESFNKGKTPFQGELIDKRDLGCGYDFCNTNESETVFIEVKGLSEIDGGVLFTNKEWSKAKKERKKYYLVLISNIKDKPIISIIQDPSYFLNATKRIYRPVQVGWTVTSGDLKRFIN